MSKAAARFHSRNRAFTFLKPLVLVVFLDARAPVQAQSAPRPEAIIKWRQSAFQVISWNTGRIRGALATDDAREIRVAAEALAGIANADLASLFPASTAQGKGWRETTARAAVWSDPAKFRALTEDFARESSALARLAAGPDRKAVRDQFSIVAKACKSCHDKFRETD